MPDLQMATQNIKAGAVIGWTLVGTFLAAVLLSMFNFDGNAVAAFSLAFTFAAAATLLFGFLPFAAKSFSLKGERRPWDAWVIAAMLGVFAWNWLIMLSGLTFPQMNGIRILGSVVGGYWIGSWKKRAAEVAP